MSYISGSILSASGMKLRFLDDPKKVFVEAEHVDNIVNLEAKAKPVVVSLKKFQWKSGEIDSVMLAIQSDTKPDGAADAWISTKYGPR